MDIHSEINRAAREGLSIAAGIGKARVCFTRMLVEAGYVIGRNEDRLSRYGVYVQGGTERLSVMVRTGDPTENLNTGHTIADEIRDWPDVHDVSTNQTERGTFFIRLTYRVWG